MCLSKWCCYHLYIIATRTRGSGEWGRNVSESRWEWWCEEEEEGRNRVDSQVAGGAGIWTECRGWAGRKRGRAAKIYASKHTDHRSTWKPSSSVDTVQDSVSSVLSVKAGVDGREVKWKRLFSECTQCCSNSWWKRRGFPLSSPPTSKWLMTANFHPKILPLRFKDRCLITGLPRRPALGGCDDYAGGRPEALFSPFLYWWWKRCLLWPPAWWCTLHLHNVSVGEKKREILFKNRWILMSLFTLKDSTEEKMCTSETVLLNWMQW